MTDKIETFGEHYNENAKNKPVKPKSRKPSRVLLTLLTVLVLGASGCAVYWFWFSPHSSVAVNRYYRQQSIDLQSSMASIASSFEFSGNIAGDLDHYEAHLRTALHACQNMGTKAKSLKAEKAYDHLSSKLRDSVHKSQQLCDDLTPLLQYSSSLYSTLRAYLLLQPQEWPAAGNNGLNSRLQNSRDAASYTIKRLNNLTMKGFSDPGLGELVTQIQSALDQMVATQAALERNDLPAATTASQQLRSDMIQDRTDFVNARAYFWTNTVGLSDLRQSINNLTTAFGGQPRS